MSLIERITDSELEFMECLTDPICASESIFSDLDNLTRFKEEFASIRLGQFSMLSYEYLIDEDESLSQKENFKLLEGAGSIYAFGARKHGKSLIVLIVDMLLSVIHLDGWRTVFSSYDAVHIRSVLERVIPVAENHPFFKIFEVHVKRSPTYFLQFRNEFVIESVNQNVASKSPGNGFYGHHSKKYWGEEASMETETVYEKRIEATSELGCVERISGMTNFTKYSPVGKIFYDLNKKPWIVNLPQYISPMWDEKERQRAIRKYAGEGSTGYKVFIKGEVVEDGIAVLDMERVRRCYMDDREIKSIEIDKNSFFIFEQRLIVDPPKNATKIYIAADIGESAPTEIVVFAEINKKYRYIYNVVLRNLTDKQQFKIFKYLAQKLKANFVGLDTTDGTGRAIYRSLEEDFGKDNLIWVSFNAKIPVDFEKDEKDNVVMKDGQPVYKEEYVSEWSVQYMKELFYEERLELPMDYKMDSQLNSLVALQSGNRVTYKCLSEEDHIFQALQVLAIMIWDSEFRSNRPISRKEFFKSGI